VKILIYSPLFYPSIGGIETTLSILAHEFVNQGHQVKVVTQVVAKDSTSFPFEVIRKPNWQNLLKLTRWCDIYFQGCVNLKGIWPLLISPRPWVVTHQTWYRRLDGSVGLQDYLKRYLTQFATNVSASSALAEHIKGLSAVVPNPYREEIFYQRQEISRDKELGLIPSLTIIGSGPEEPNLRQQVKQLDIVEQVNFAGAKVETDLAQLLNAHKILVVPSVWEEPFGIVALEGIACGCVVVGSEAGGLKDAIGACGVTFPNGDVNALTQALFDLLTNPDKLAAYREKAESHLSCHTKAAVAKAYLQVLEKVIQ